MFRSPDRQPPRAREATRALRHEKRPHVLLRPATWMGVAGIPFAVGIAHTTFGWMVPGGLGTAGAIALTISAQTAFVVAAYKIDRSHASRRSRPTIGRRG